MKIRFLPRLECRQIRVRFKGVMKTDDLVSPLQYLKYL